MTTHRCPSTHAAYDACQCDPAFRDGDTLLVYNERVVGLVWTWPVAVTASHGALHTFAPDARLTRLLTDMHCTDAHLARAVALADTLGYPLHPVVAQYLGR